MEEAAINERYILMQNIRHTYLVFGHTMNALNVSIYNLNV